VKTACTHKLGQTKAQDVEAEQVSEQVTEGTGSRWAMAEGKMRCRLRQEVVARVGRWGLLEYWCLQQARGEWWMTEKELRKPPVKGGEWGSKYAKKTWSGLTGLLMLRVV
jgi:hypothetical protein